MNRVAITKMNRGAIVNELEESLKYHTGFEKLITEALENAKTPVKILRELLTDVRQALTTKPKIVEGSIKADNTTKKPKVKPTKPAAPAEGKDTAKEVPLGKMFPKTIEIEGHLFTAAEDIKNFDDFKKAVEKGEVLYIFNYWTADLIKEFNYSKMYGLKNFKAKSFKDDLDACEVIYVADKEDYAIAVSAYSNANCIYFKDEFNYVEDGKCKIRYSNNMEFEIYRTEVQE